MMAIPPQPGIPLSGGEKGLHIMEESFAIIERELGPHSFPPWAFAVLRRMIHASADFEFSRTLCYSPDFEAAARSALAARLPIVTDTEMVLLGNVALRLNKTIEWDSAHLRVKNAPEAGRLIKKRYRSGWRV